MPVFSLLNNVFELFALIVGSYYFRRIKQRFLYLYIFVWIAFITESLLVLSIKLGTQNNHLISHLYFPLEFLFLSLLYLKELGKFYKTNWMKVVIVLFMTYCVVNSLFIQKFVGYSQVRSFSSIIFVIYSILYYYRVMTEAKIIKLSDEPMVWINTAVLLYFAGSLFNAVLFRLTLEYSMEFARHITNFYGVLNVIFYLLIAIGFWKAGKQNVADGS